MSAYPVANAWEASIAMISGMLCATLMLVSKSPAPGSLGESRILPLHTPQLGRARRCMHLFPLHCGVGAAQLALRRVGAMCPCYGILCIRCHGKD